MKNHLFCFIFISFQLFGQSNIDTISINQKPNLLVENRDFFSSKSIVLSNHKNNEFIFEEKILNETSLPEKDSKTKYTGIVEFGIQSLQGESGINRLKLDIINGLQINPNFSVGLGTGVRLYNGIALIPFFLDLRTIFNQNKVSPYFSLGFGHTVNATLDFKKEGLLVNPNFGISIKNSKKSETYIGIGYEFQKMKFRKFNINNYNYYNITIEEYYKNTGVISLNLGISFE